MQRLFTLLLFYILISTSLTLSASEVNTSLGILTRSDQTLILDQTQIPLYEAFDTLYFPSYFLSHVGYTVEYSKSSDTVIIKDSFEHASPVDSSSLLVENFTSTPFHLFSGEIYLESLKTHGIVSNNRVLIPVESLNALGKVTPISNGYFFQYSTPPPVRAYPFKIENLLAEPITVTIKDLYWHNTWVTHSNTYTLSPYEIIMLPSKDTRLKHISTSITSLYTSTNSYIYNSNFGQMNTGLFTMYTRAQSIGDLSTLGDSISLSDAIWAEDTLNAMNLTSDTPFLVWTHIPTQKTYIFKSDGSQFKLIKHFISSTGKPSSPTPTGQYKLTKKVPYFGVEKGYRCKNAFGFIGTTYLYHSVMYDKTGSYLLKGTGTLGTPASGGCIRLSPENSAWFYKTLLPGSTVIITK